MPIPPRLLPPPISAVELQEYTALCREIKDTIAIQGNFTELLKQWNKRARRHYHELDFGYHTAKDIDDFVVQMLMGSPPFVPDLTYPELRAVLEAVLSADLSEAEYAYYVDWLETNLPVSNVSDLIYWPHVWFEDDALLHVEMSPDQLLAYAIRKSNRIIPSAPDNIVLPYPIPVTD